MLEINKIYNMDCLEGMDLMIKQGIKVDAIINDPPYGTTNCKWDIAIPFEEMWDRLKKVRKNERTPIVLFSKQPFTSLLITSNLDLYKYSLVWKKDNHDNPLNAKKRFLNITEDINIFYEKQCLYNPQGIIKVDKITKQGRGKSLAQKNERNSEYIQEYTNYPKNILEFSRDLPNIHPTQKPVALIEYLIKTYTNEGDLVLDFTIGSGTTAVACLNTNRNYIGFELDNTYYELAKNRINKHILDNNLQDKYKLIA